MLKRNVLLGGLVAGAFLLPTVAGAGVVSGPCVNCHTMHASQDGVAGIPNPTLLVGDGCIGCHATGAANGADGTAQVGTTAVFAPQVLDSVNPNAGGYFTDAVGQHNIQHNVAGLLVGIDTVMTGNLITVSPGGTFLLDNGAGAPALTCASCHSASGGHHAVSGTSYRLLPGTNTTTPDANYSNPQTVAGGRGDNNTYDATAMNTFCAACHSDFHGNTTVGAQVNATGEWIRHPTDISVVNVGGNSIKTMDVTGDSSATLLGTAGANTDIIMCITCHYPHGSGQPDNLAFVYDATTNLAGDPTVDVGCESCHGYAVNGGGM